IKTATKLHRKFCGGSNLKPVRLAEQLLQPAKKATARWGAIACQRCNFCCCCCWISGTINCSTRYDDISTCVLDLLHCSRLNPTSHRDLQACVQASNQRQVAEWCLPCSLLVKTSMHANNMSTQFSCF